MATYKITLALVRSFGLGFKIHSPKLNGISFEIQIACFIFRFWGKGFRFITIKNYWDN